MGRYSARGGFSGGMSNIQKQQLQMQKLMEMQKEMETKQADVEAQEFTASAGGGAVTATVNGKKELTHLVIKPEAADPEDVEMLQDLVMSAVNEAIRTADGTMTEAMNAFTGNLSSFGL